jgi:hypothetical protein
MMLMMEDRVKRRLDVSVAVPRQIWKLFGCYYVSLLGVS